MPPVESAQGVADRFNKILDQAVSAGNVEDLEVLDANRQVKYYKGRWVSPKRLTGRFVARRNQRYGARLWCYVEMSNGELTRLYDIPAGEWRAFAYAWQLQMAIDNLAGHPQVFSAAPGPDGRVEVSVYSPLPTWVRMRWEILGDLLEPSKSLFRYAFDREEYLVERQFLLERLWMTEVDDPRTAA
jgi:hypothetical protein